MRFRDKNGPTLHPILQTAGFAGFFRRRAQIAAHFQQIFFGLDYRTLESALETGARLPDAGD